MKIFYNPIYKKVFELNEERLKIYQRLIRLHHENPESLHYIFRVLTKIEASSKVHLDIVAQLIEINLLRCVDNGVSLNTDHLSFIQFITNEKRKSVGLFYGFNVLTDVRLNTGIKMGFLNLKTNEIENIQSISPEAIKVHDKTSAASGCCCI